MKILFRLIIVWSYLMAPMTAMGQITNPYGTKDFSQTLGKEYYVGQSLGQPLMTVNIINGVGAPGVYHVPVNTNMAELFSYAGGATENADLELVTVRSKSKDGTSKVHNFNFEKLVQSPGNLPQIQDKDIVHIETRDKLETSLKWLTLLSLITSITATIVVINDRD